MIKDNANIAGLFGQRQPELLRMEEIIRLSGGNPKPEFFKEYYLLFDAVTQHTKLLDKMKKYYYFPR